MEDNFSNQNIDHILENNVLNNFSRRFLKSLKENSYYTLIINDNNYENYFKQGHSFEFLYNFFNINPVRIDDKNILKLPFDDILGFYLVNKNSISQNDENFIKSINNTDINTLINDSFNKVTSMKNFSKKISLKIYNDLSELNQYKSIEYVLSENNEEKIFSLFLREDSGDIGREVDENDALILFNLLETNSRFPVIIFSNSVAKIIGKFSTKYSVDFELNHITNLKLPPNSISILKKSGEITILNFETKKCKIETNSKLINDDKVKKIQDFFSIIYFREDETNEKINGSIEFSFNIKSDSSSAIKINYFGLYKFFITDNIASTLFYIDEVTNAWCSKSNFYIFFRDFSNEMIDNIEIKNSKNYLRLSIPTGNKEIKNSIKFDFKANSKNILESFLDKFFKLFSRLISNIHEQYFYDFQSKTNTYKIYKKLINALMDKGSEFFKHESNKKDENSDIKTGHYYTRVCPAKQQPIIIEEEEKEDWIRYGRKPILFPPNESIKDKILIVCPMENYKYVNLRENNQDPTGRIKQLPCCIKSDKPQNKSLVYTEKSNNRTGTSELITQYQEYGTLNDALATFLSTSFSETDKFIFKRQGTILKTNNFTYLNSAIIGILLAIVKDLQAGQVEQHVIETRNRMAQLPPDVYKQELYDMSDEKIVESILNPETFIDPYLYYRGLEIIFNIQIFTFTSNIGRKNPISNEENELEIATLEVPRCKYMHIRNDNGKDIVCLYKNYGSKNKNSKNTACELIVSSNGNDKKCTKKINKKNVLFFKNIFKLLDKTCHPYEWEKSNDIPISNSCYDNPYNTINWNEYDFGELGQILGQEIDIFGKTNAILFKEWTLMVPPTQPLYIEENEDGNMVFKRIFIKDKYGNIHSREIMTGGTKNRAFLKRQEIACEKFEVTSFDEDGVWIEFNGKEKGIKILCQSKMIKSGNKTFNSALDLINKKNNISILLQIINWLWRSDWDGEKFPNFIEWWNNNTRIEDSIIYYSVPNPQKNCNNMMLPELNSFNQRILAMSKIWPFFFYRNKIHVSIELFERIKNNFNIEDIYSRGLTPEDIYGQNRKFITDLIITDDDFVSNDSLILTKIEQFSDWIRRNNSNNFKFESIYNCIVMKEKIHDSLKNLNEQYIYKETIGDNPGQIYIIQNSSIKSKPQELSALQIAQHWRTHSVNPGHNYKRNDDIEFIKNSEYVLYKVDSNGILKIHEDRSKNNNSYLQIMCYGNEENFAAMLPLLA